MNTSLAETRKQQSTAIHPSNSPCRGHGVAGAIPAAVDGVYPGRDASLSSENKKDYRSTTDLNMWFV